VSETRFGKYRLLVELGRGGMADVYLASSSGPGGFQKLVVIKVSRVSDDPAFAQMFLDEARLSARLEHPNVVQTYEVGEENGRQYIVMEFLDGASLYRLNRLAAPSGGVPLRLVVQMLSNVLGGLQYAHTLTDFDGTPLNVVHRDLSPQNLMITAQGACKLLDFGIAKTSDSRTMTHAGFYRGKLNYMSPEQAVGEAVDARADIFSVGVLLAEAITRKPFWGEVTGAVISARLIRGDIPNIEEANIEPLLEEICATALAPNRDQRLRSAKELKEALDWFLDTDGGPVSADELAAYVAPLIAEDRARVHSLVDQQLKQGAPMLEVALPQLKAQATSAYASVTSAPITPFAASPRGSGYTPGSAKRPTREPLVPEQMTVAEPQPLSQSGATRVAATAPHSARWVPGAVVAGFVVLVGLVVWLATRAPVPQPAAAQAATAPAQVVNAPPPPKVERVEISIEPRTATLAVDGEQVSNPYVVTSLDHHRHRVMAQAPGFEAQTREVLFDRDQTLTLALVPMAATTESPAAPAPHRGTPSRRPGKDRAVAPPPTRDEPPAPVAAPEASPFQELTPKPRAAAGKGIDTDVFEDKKKDIDRTNPWESPK
jgi:eukaryotic-like serine/threonine-protein kinase